MPSTERRTTWLQIRCTAAERASWQAKATAAGVPLSQLVRRALDRVRTWTAKRADLEREPGPASWPGSAATSTSWPGGPTPTNRPLEAVTVIAHLTALSRELGAFASSEIEGEADDAH